MSQFEPLDCVAAGIVPLSLNPKYVKMADDPYSISSGGFKFLAGKMQVDLPPLPLLTPAEFSMIKEFCFRHPQPKSEDIEHLCKQFLEKSNGDGIFPLLPSLIKPGIKRWEMNESI